MTPKMLAVGPAVLSGTFLRKQYVWVRVSYDYAETNIDGIYFTLAGAMDGHPESWQRVTEEHYREDPHNNLVGKYIQRMEMEQ